MKVYAVTRPRGADDREFEIYQRMLEERGIDVARQPRVADPELSMRWLYAWDDPAEAERFADELRRRTGDEQWTVRPCPEKLLRTEPLDHLVIGMTRQSSGATFFLESASKLLLQSKLPERRRASTIFLGDERLPDPEAIDGSLYEQVARLLTGMTEEELKTFGGFRVVHPVSGATYYRWPPRGT